METIANNRDKDHFHKILEQRENLHSKTSGVMEGSIENSISEMTKPPMEYTPAVDGKQPESCIPTEIIVSEILTRLPAKSIIKCSLVCKSWYSLIRNPNFFSKYRGLNLPKSKEIFFLNLLGDAFTIISGSTLKKYAKFRAPYTPFQRYLVGSCNGLFLFRSSDGEVFWYNPLFRILKLVETLPYSAPDDTLIYGFGYDEMINDYKLVKLTFSLKGEDYVEIYSLSEDSWYRLQEKPQRQIMNSYTRNPRYFNGAVHWLTAKNFGNLLDSIVSFDFKKDVFVETTLPRELQTSYYSLPDIFEVRGSLALLLEKGYGHGREYHVWVMNEFDSADSWTRKLVIPSPETCRWLCCTTDGTILLGNWSIERRKSSLELYDWEIGKLENVAGQSSNAGHFMEFFWN